MRRGASLEELQRIAGNECVECVVDATDWDAGKCGFVIWSRDRHHFVDGVCDWCGTIEVNGS